MSESDREALLARRQRDGVSEQTGFVSGGDFRTVTLRTRPPKTGERIMYPAAVVTTYSRAEDEILKQEVSLKAMAEKVAEIQGMWMWMPVPDEWMPVLDEPVKPAKEMTFTVYSLGIGGKK